MQVLLLDLESTHTVSNKMNLQEIIKSHNAAVTKEIYVKAEIVAVVEKWKAANPGLDSLFNGIIEDINEL